MDQSVWLCVQVCVCKYTDVMVSPMWFEATSQISWISAEFEIIGFIQLSFTYLHTHARMQAHAYTLVCSCIQYIRTIGSTRTYVWTQTQLQCTHPWMDWWKEMKNKELRTAAMLLLLRFVQLTHLGVVKAAHRCMCVPVSECAACTRAPLPTAALPTLWHHVTLGSHWGLCWEHRLEQKTES